MKRNNIKTKQRNKKKIISVLRKINEGLSVNNSNIRLYIIRAGKKLKITDQEGYMLDMFVKNYGVTFNSLKKSNNNENTQVIEYTDIRDNIIDITNYIVKNIETLRLNKPYKLVTRDGKWVAKRVYFDNGQVHISFAPITDRFPFIISDKEYADNIVSASDKDLIIEEYTYKK